MEQGAEWLISIVFDSRGENPYTRVDFKEPIHHALEAELEVTYPTLDSDELKSLEEEFEEKSKARIPSYTTTYKSAYPFPYSNAALASKGGGSSLVGFE